MGTLFMDTCMDLLSRDIPITYEAFVNTVKEYIDNLRSHIGKEAHEQEAAMGVIDETGMTREEQDAACERQIREYKQLLEYLEDDNNWII